MRVGKGKTAARTCLLMAFLTLPLSEVTADCPECPIGQGLNDSYCLENPATCIGCTRGTFNDRDGYIGACRISRDCERDYHRNFRFDIDDGRYSADHDTLCDRCLDGSTGGQCVTDDPTIDCPACTPCKMDSPGDDCDSWKANHKLRKGLKIFGYVIGAVVFVLLLAIGVYYSMPRLVKWCRERWANKPIQAVNQARPAQQAQQEEGSGDENEPLNQQQNA